MRGAKLIGVVAAALIVTGCAAQIIGRADVLNPREMSQTPPEIPLRVGYYISPAIRNFAETIYGVRFEVGLRLAAKVDEHFRRTFRAVTPLYRFPPNPREAEELDVVIVIEQPKLVAPRTGLFDIDPKLTVPFSVHTVAGERMDQITEESSVRVFMGSLNPVENIDKGHEAVHILSRATVLQFLRSFRGTAVARAASATPGPVLTEERSSGGTVAVGSSQELVAAAAPKRESAPAASGISAGLYQLEQAIDFNVLDSVVLNPSTGQITLIGHRDQRYAGPKIPYLQHLATLLESPAPQFSLNWTPESEARVDQLFRRMDSDEEVEKMAAQWGYWVDENQRVTPMGRFFLPLFGVTPTNDRYEIVASMLRASGNEKGADIVSKAGAARRLMNKPGGKQAGQDLIAATGAYESLGELQAQVRRGEITAREFKIRLGRSMCVGMDRAFGLTDQPVRRAFDRSIRRGMDLGAALTKAFGELDNQLRTVLKIAMDKLLSRHDQITIPPEVMQATVGIRPEVTPEYIGMDSRSQLARVMFEADSIGKQLPNRVDLEKKIPRYKTYFAFERENPNKAGRFKPTTTEHLWISTEKLDLAQSKDGYTLETRGVKMRFNIREMKDGRSVPAAPGPYEELLTSLYDDLAQEFPVLHELRETAKLKAAAQWLKTHKPDVRLPAVGRSRWNGPSKVPGLIYFTWTPKPRPGSIVASMMAMGGVSLVLPDRTIPVDASVVDLRPSRLVAVPESGPAVLRKIVPLPIEAPVPRPVGWVTSEEAGEQTVTAVSVVVEESGRDTSTAVRLGRSLEEEAAILWRTDDLEGAEHAYRELVEQYSNDPGKAAAYRMLWAQVLHEKGDDAAAIKELNAAVRLAPDHPLVHLLLGKALYESGDRQGAIQALKHYLALDPQNQAAANLLRELGGQGEAVEGKGEAEGPRRRWTSIWKHAKSTLAHSGAAAGMGGKASSREETQFGFDTAPTRPSASTSSPVAVPPAGPPREPPPALAKRPQMIKLQQEKERLMKQYRDLEKQLGEIKEKKARGEGDKGQLDVQEVEIKQKMAETTSEIGVVTVKIESFPVEFEEESRKETEEGTTPTGAKPEATAPSAPPSTPEDKKP